MIEVSFKIWGSWILKKYIFLVKILNGSQARANLNPLFNRKCQRMELE